MVNEINFPAWFQGRETGETGETGRSSMARRRSPRCYDKRAQFRVSRWNDKEEREKEKKKKRKKKEGRNPKNRRATSIHRDLLLPVNKLYDPVVLRVPLFRSSRSTLPDYYPLSPRSRSEISFFGGKFFGISPRRFSPEKFPCRRGGFFGI